MKKVIPNKTEKKVDEKTEKKIRPRKDKVRNLGRVAKVLLNNPNSTQREIAKQAKISLGNVNSKLNDIEQGAIKDDRILEICDNDIQIVEKGQAILLDRLTNDSKNMSTRDVIATVDTGAKRYTIFKGDLTDPHGGLKNQITPEQRQSLLDRLDLDE